jgi:polyhydroxyalkanoate synthase
VAKNKGKAVEKDELAENMAKVADGYKQMIDKYLESTEDLDISGTWFDIYQTWIDTATSAFEHPEEFQKKQAEVLADYMKIWTNAYARYIGEENSPIYQSDPKDRRFRDATWNNDLVFDFMKQSYLFTNKWTHDYIDGMKGIDKRTKNKMEFYTKQYLDAVSPSNFAFTNPEVIRETINTKGENLVNGLRHLMEDMEKSKIKTTDESAFHLGVNIAATKGKVIYRNDLMELIQYEPSQKQTHRRPLLIIPAWINKYYILDLSPHNSFVKWAVDQGYTVFMISWVNPGKELAHKSFDHYMLEGPLAALDAIEQATGEKEITACGYCLGGTLLTCTLAYMKAKGDERIKAITYLTTMVDFANSGDLCLFIDEEHLEKIDKQMQKHGVLEGDDMSTIFSILRANDLIWSFVVNNYLMGKEPFPFDILYWNGDSTRLPADTHSFYLRNMYLKNALTKKGGISLVGVPIDVSKIDVPIYSLATKEDHIAPWKTVYSTTQLVKSKVKFILSASGHVAGVVNPPITSKYHYFTAESNPKDPEDWLVSAKEYAGSWWPDWDKWLAELSGGKVPAPKPGSGKLKPLGDAPGTYVKVKD